MSSPKLVNTIASAIQTADSSYFNENYTKQAQAVLAAIDKAGFALIPKSAPADIWTKAAEQMRTGRLRPDEHVKDVYEVVLRLLEGK